MRKVIGCLHFFILFALPSLAQQSLSLSGKITDKSSSPVQGASVHVLNSNLGAITDAGGHFTITSISTGKYIIEITAIGYASVSQAVSVSSGKSEEITIQLADIYGQLDEVLVSAQKKEENLQQVPFSISALTARQVKDYRLWNNKELTAIIPNLYSNNSGDNRNVTSVRGIATTSYEPAVVTYIDGVNQFSLDTYIAQLLDVERIEVLRGPQGALYGRNAMGGVINIITKQPSNTPSGYAELNTGNYGHQRYAMGIRSPIVKNKIFVGVSALYDARKGYYTNTFNNTSFDRQNSFTGNYFVKYLATSKLAFTMNVKHYNGRNKGPFPLVFGKDAAFADPFKLNQNATTTMRDDVFNGSLSANYSGNKFNFSSQTAFQNNWRLYETPIDGDFSPIDGVTIINNYGKPWNNVKVFTQEFKFSSPAGNASPFKWTAGSFIFHQDNPNKQATRFGKDAAMLGSPDSMFSLINTAKGKSTGIAFYGQGTYSINDKLDLIAGLRYDRETKKQSVKGEYQHDPNPDPLFDYRPDTSAKASFSAFSPKLGLSYKLSANSNLYGTYSRGYRAGGFTQLSSDPSQPPLFAYEPEFSNNFEVGVKNDFLQKRLRINLSAFYTNVENVQVPTLVLPDAITIIRNAGKLTTKGIEADVSATASKGLELEYHFGWNNAEYKTLKLSQNGQEADLAGNKQIFTPDVTSMFAAQYTYQPGGKHALKLIVRGEWIHLGKQYFDLANTISQDAYSLFNTRFGIAAKNAEFMFWARNIGNTKYIAYAYDFGGVHLGNPGTYGLSVGLRF
jgi:iron complex outermembrane recepter protein